MENYGALIVVVLISALIVLITVWLIKYFARFNNDTRRITREMQRACDDGKYRYWRRKLRCHYLCLIPFVNERNVRRIYKRIYHRSGSGKSTKRSDGLYHILAPSLIGICVCAVCLCGASWAWFASTQTSNVSGIRAATYTVDVTAVKDESSAEVTSNGGIYTIPIESGGSYEITITANGTATNGYCTVTVGGQIYHTPQIEKDTDFTFTLNAYQSGILTITPQWGTCSASENIINPEISIESGTNP